MKLAPAQLERMAAEAGFQAEPFEKVLHLLELLDALRSHPFLGDRLVLKGGTAINLFVLDLARLSVDVDLNYIGAVDRKTMLAERPKVEKAVQAVCRRQGLTTRRVPNEHAGGKWRLSYERAAGGTGALELDLNFLLRSPLWTPAPRDSLSLASTAAQRIPVLEPHELAAGKLSALFTRQASRDLHDTHALLSRGDLDQRSLRLAFVLYGGMSRRDWRTVSIDDVQIDSKDADRRLIPLLRADVVPARRDLEAWCTHLLGECRDLLSCVLPLTPEELEFLEHLNGRGEIAPDLLTDDARLQGIARSHPGLLWKALNVHRHTGRVGVPGAPQD